MEHWHNVGSGQIAEYVSSVRKESVSCNCENEQ